MIILGNNMEVLRTVEDDSIDAVVTDPPYGIAFMNKKWDYDVPSVELWKEVLRVLKPGGHALIACGTRTQHRMVCNIEDAGFEVRDVITWLYGSGFPKSHNLGNGWGTALKPACEFWTLVRKPFKGTVADNVLKHGTGAINIDECRVEAGKDYEENCNRNSVKSHWGASEGCVSVQASALGRWPANLILDEEAAALLDEQTEGTRASRPRGGNTVNRTFKTAMFNMGADNEISGEQFNDTGGASRFFYCAKASKSERGTDNNHPTVKPIKLMEYLIKLITPPNGIVLDPFAGSGSTGVAAKKLGFEFIGIELDGTYSEIARKRYETA